jgi:hypothetical protein
LALRHLRVPFFLFLGIGGPSGSCRECSGEPKLPQQGPLLLLVGLHALQNVRKNAYAGYRVRPFVQHHAFRALAHRGIRNLGP